MATTQVTTTPLMPCLISFLAHYTLKITIDPIRTLPKLVTRRVVGTRCARSPTMSTSQSGGEVFERNPYEGKHGLSELEAEVLWQYAKLSQNVKEVRHTPTAFPQQ